MIDHLRNKWITVGSVVVLLTGFLFACVLVAPASAAEVTKLKLGTFTGSAGLHGDGLRYIAEEVKKRTNGRVEIEIIWGEALAKALEISDAVRVGTADMGHFVSVYLAEQFPFVTTCEVVRFRVDVPFTRDVGPRALSIYRKLAEEFPEVANEFKKLNQIQLGVFSYPSEGLISKKPVRTLADLKGWKIRSWGKIVPQIIRGLDAAPVSMPAVEVYDGLSKGVLDATIASVETTYRYKYFEIVKYWCKSLTEVFGPLPLTYPITVNLDKWGKISREDQKVMLEVGDAATRKFSEDSYTTLENYYKELTQKYGMITTEVPDAEIKALRAKCGSTMYEDYMKKIEAAGYPTIRKVSQRHIELWSK
jgi:TRAP-type C4-dicarboxylate transport system substrate-binding protein